jgi:hypothetical protein
MKLDDEEARGIVARPRLKARLNNTTVRVGRTILQDVALN